MKWLVRITVVQWVDHSDINVDAYSAFADETKDIASVTQELIDRAVAGHYRIVNINTQPWYGELP